MTVYCKKSNFKYTFLSWVDFRMQPSPVIYLVHLRVIKFIVSFVFRVTVFLVALNLISKKLFQEIHGITQAMAEDLYNRGLVFLVFYENLVQFS